MCVDYDKIGTEVITIEEIEAPDGYNKLFETIEVTITKEVLSNGVLGVTKAEITRIDGENASDKLGISTAVDGEIITITIPNKRQEGNYS